MRIGFGNRQLTYFLQICRKMDSGSNNVVPAASTQVVTPIVAQVIMMPTIMPISILSGEKPEKFNELNFKRL